MTEKLILVTGITGKQGGSVARALLDQGLKVRGLTRKPDSEAAQALKNLGVEIFNGDFNDSKSLVKAVTGVNAVFSVSTPFESGTDSETRQGIAIADAAKEARVNHLVYTSVAGADRQSGIPHFDSKYEVEKHIQKLDIPYTIIAPVYFMENLLFPWTLESIKNGIYSAALPADRKLQQIATANIGKFGAFVIANPDNFIGRRIDIAGDELSGQELAEKLSKVLGRRISYQEQSIEHILASNKDLGLMFEWFNKVGYSADIRSLRKDYPEVGWLTFDEWLKKQDHKLN